MEVILFEMKRKVFLFDFFVVICVDVKGECKLVMMSIVISEVFEYEVFFVFFRVIYF